MTPQKQLVFLVMILALSSGWGCSASRPQWEETREMSQSDAEAQICISIRRFTPLPFGSKERESFSIVEWNIHNVNGNVFFAQSGVVSALYSKELNRIIVFTLKGVATISLDGNDLKYVSRAEYIRKGAVDDSGRFAAVIIYRFDPIKSMYFLVVVDLKNGLSSELQISSADGIAFRKSELIVRSSSGITKVRVEAGSANDPPSIRVSEQ